MKIATTALTIALLILACAGSESSSTETSDDRRDVKEASTTGRKISTLAQGALVSQLSRALSQGDAASAIQFCNIEASAIVDSINRAHNCTVRRLTSRRRNPANKIETRQDKIAWNYFRTHTEERTMDTVLVEPGASAVYYKPIFIASELCLNCHGSRSQDIELATLEKISELYPADAAVNYHLGDLRGMWKISFQEDVER